MGAGTTAGGEGGVIGTGVGTGMANELDWQLLDAYPIMFGRKGKSERILSDLANGGDDDRSFDNFYDGSRNIGTDIDNKYRRPFIGPLQI